MKHDIQIWATGVEVVPDTAGRVVVKCDGVEASDIVGQIGEGALLDEIGEDAAIKHFRLELAD